MGSGAEVNLNGGNGQIRVNSNCGNCELNRLVKLKRTWAEEKKIEQH